LIRTSVFGLGRVGLVTAACFAKRGFQVIGIDTNREAIQLIRDLQFPFYEPKLNAYLREAIRKRNLRITDRPEESTRADLVYLTVGTPSGENGAIDLSQVRAAATMIGRSMRDCRRFQTVVIKSTVTPGTARQVIKPILQQESSKSAGQDFGLVSNPEFLREGSAIRDTEHPDRIVIGGEHPKIINKLEAFYEKFHDARLPPVIRTTHENAELIKYANNAYLATKVSFINTIACIAERIESADICTVTKGIAPDAKARETHLNAGLGYGGSCLTKDLRAFIQMSRGLGYNPELLNAVKEVNLRQPDKALEFATRVLRSIRDSRVAILGLAFKPETDEMREAVSIPIIRGLLLKGAKVIAYDPAANKSAKKVFGDQIDYATDPRQCIRDADLAIIVTEWDVLKTLTPSDFLSLMRTPIVFDGRRVFDHTDMRAAGIDFSAVGLGPHS
jgi:nucleotide sugar dehydrogenase